VTFIICIVKQPHAYGRLGPFPATVCLYFNCTFSLMDTCSCITERLHKLTGYCCSQGRRSLWDRGDVSPPIFGVGGHYYECPPQYFRVISVTFHPCNMSLSVGRLATYGLCALTGGQTLLSQLLLALRVYQWRGQWQKRWRFAVQG